MRLWFFEYGRSDEYSIIFEKAVDKIALMY